MSNETPVARTLSLLMERRGIDNGHSLAQLANVEQPMIWRLLNGRVKNPRASTVAPLLQYFGVTYSQFIGDEPLPHLADNTAAYTNVTAGPEITMVVPKISWVQAGHWQEIIDNYHPGDFESVTPVSKNVSPRSFALTVQGDSMEPKFPEGCTIVVDPEREPFNKAFVIAKTPSGTEATFKQLIYDGGAVYLKPLNERYPIIEMLEGSQVCGVVRHMLWDLD